MKKARARYQFHTRTARDCIDKIIARLQRAHRLALDKQSVCNRSARINPLMRRGSRMRVLASAHRKLVNK